MDDKVDVIQLWGLLEKAKAFVESFETLSVPSRGMVYHRLPPSIEAMATEGVNRDARELHDALALLPGVAARVADAVANIQNDRNLSGEGRANALRRLGEGVLNELRNLWMPGPGKLWKALAERGQHLGKRNTWEGKLSEEKDALAYMRHRETREILAAKGPAKAGAVVRDAARAGRRETVAAILTAVPEADPIVDDEVIERAIFDLYAVEKPDDAVWLTAFEIAQDGAEKATTTIREHVRAECGLAARPGGPTDPDRDRWAGKNLTAMAKAAREEREARERAEAERAKASAPAAR